VIQGHQKCGQKCGRDARIVKPRRPARDSATSDPPHRWKLAACLFGTLLISATLGCGTRRGLFIEGVWTDKDRPTARFHFRPDGTGRLTDDCSPVNLDVGSGIDFTWRRVGNGAKVSFKGAGRDSLATLRENTLHLEPADSMRSQDGHFLSNPRTLIWFEHKR